MLASTDATTSVYALDSALRIPVAEVRTATDLVGDPWAQFADVMRKAMRERRSTPETASTQQAAQTEASPSAAAPFLAGMNPWLLDAMTIVEAHRRTLTDQEKRTPPLLSSAEMLASFMADIGARRRPQLNIEPSGRPTFATATDDFYIHLTIDEPNRLTWYAVVRGTEYFNEGVPFDGRKLPSELAQLFSL